MDLPVGLSLPQDYDAPGYLWPSRCGGKTWLVTGLPGPYLPLSAQMAIPQIFLPSVRVRQAFSGNRPVLSPFFGWAASVRP